MSPYEAITVARRELAQSGMIRLVGNRMEPHSFENKQSAAIAAEIAIAYNTLASIHESMKTYGVHSTKKDFSKERG